jgi:hypothetical protein
VHRPILFEHLVGGTRQNHAKPESEQPQRWVSLRRIGQLGRRLTVRLLVQRREIWFLQRDDKLSYGYWITNQIPVGLLNQYQCILPALASYSASSCSNAFPTFEPKHSLISRLAKHSTRFLVVTFHEWNTVLTVFISPRSNWVGTTVCTNREAKKSLVRVLRQTIPTERQPLVGEVSDNFCG